MSKPAKSEETTPQLANTSTKIEQIAKELFHINYLVAFPISDPMLEGWARSIDELDPQATPEEIKELIGNMKKGLEEFDKNKGIQNIFIGLRRLRMKKMNEIRAKEIFPQANK